MPAGNGKYKFVLFFQYVLLLGDLLLNSFVMMASYSNVTMLVLHIIQDVCILFSGIILFIMFINTQLFQAGLVTVLINKFKFAIAALLLYLTLSITLHVWSLNEAWEVELFYTRSDGFAAFYAVHRIVSVAFYYSYKRAALIMSDPRLYGDPQLVQDVFDSRQP